MADPTLQLQEAALVKCRYFFPFFSSLVTTSARTWVRGSEGLGHIRVRGHTDALTDLTSYSAPGVPDDTPKQSMPSQQ